MIYLRYIKYLFWHKVFTMIEAFHLGIPWLGLIHDWSKFRPSEFTAYAKHFFGNGEHVNHHRAATGKNDIDDIAFNYAWLAHQRRNRHHWEFYCLILKGGKLKPLEMPLRYRVEMVSDWIGAGRAKNRPDTRAWYLKYRDKMLLAPRTRAWVDGYFRR